MARCQQQGRNSTYWIAETVHVCCSQAPRTNNLHPQRLQHLIAITTVGIQPLDTAYEVRVVTTCGRHCAMDTHIVGVWLRQAFQELAAHSFRSLHLVVTLLQVRQAGRRRLWYVRNADYLGGTVRGCAMAHVSNNTTAKQLP